MKTMLFMCTDFHDCIVVIRLFFRYEFVRKRRLNFFHTRADGFAMWDSVPRVFCVSCIRSC